MSSVSRESSGAPRVLLDATAVPADRGGVGRYVDGLVGAPLRGRRSDLVVVCQRSDAERFEPARRRRRGRRRAVRHRAPPGPAGLGADRAAAGRPAGRRRRDPLAVLHDAAARAGAGRGHRARRHVLLRARAAQRGQDRLLPLGDPHRGAAGQPGHRAVAGDPRRAGPAARRRPGRIDVAYHGVDTATFHPPSEAETRAGHRPARAARPALRRLPRRARAAQERPRPGARLGPGRRRHGRAARAGAGRRQRLGRRRRPGGRRGARRT